MWTWPQQEGGSHTPMQTDVFREGHDFLSCFVSLLLLQGYSSTVKKNFTQDIHTCSEYIWMRETGKSKNAHTKSLDVKSYKVTVIMRDCNDVMTETEFQFLPQPLMSSFSHIQRTKMTWGHWQFVSWTSSLPNANVFPLCGWLYSVLFTCTILKNSSTYFTTEMQPFYPLWLVSISGLEVPTGLGRIAFISIQTWRFRVIGTTSARSNSRTLCLKYPTKWTWRERFWENICRVLWNVAVGMNLAFPTVVWEMCKIFLFFLQVSSQKYF